MPPAMARQISLRHVAALLFSLASCWICVHHSPASEAVTGAPQVSRRPKRENQHRPRRRSRRPTSRTLPWQLPLPGNLIRPKPVSADVVAAALRVDARVDHADAAAAIMDGSHVLVSEKWGSTMAIREELNKLTQAVADSAEGNTEAEAHRSLRAARRAVNRRILVSANVKTGDLDLHGGPSHIGYLPAFYSDDDSAEDGRLVFQITDIAAMNTAWQYHLNGVKYPFLEQTLRPFFGVFFQPSPFQHFLQLDEYLEQNPDQLTGKVLDLGTGCGVVTLLLRQRRPDTEIVASDISPNAVFSVEQEVERFGLSGVSTVQSDMFESPEAQGPFDAIVFNPPWVPSQPFVEGSRDENIIGGNDYPPGFFESFLAKAPAVLRPGGRLLVLFSNYAQERGLVKASPLQEAFDSAGDGLRLLGVSRSAVAAAQHMKWRRTCKEKSWASSHNYSAELWEFERL